MKTDYRSTALSTIHAAITPLGLMATSISSENYDRVWSRDSNMTGIAGFLAGDTKTIAAWGVSLDTLRDHQHEAGFIPSNVGGPQVSYGSLVGRVDSTLWYIIGVRLYHSATHDDQWLDSHIKSVSKAIALCQAWEFNGRHLIYTPLSGNWADEYPIQGYTLYDNCLRLWGLRLWSDTDLVDNDKVRYVEQSINDNFWLRATDDQRYHNRLYQDEVQKRQSQHWEAGFSPARYYSMFDAAGNGLALMLGLGSQDQVDDIVAYIDRLTSTLGANLVPAFWPVIRPGDDLDGDLRQNYAYSFKNDPHHFHNGGIWPIMMGWLSVGLTYRQRDKTAKKLLKAYEEAAIREDFIYYEYIESKTFTPGGKTSMCYSASGHLLMMSAKEVVQRIL